MHADKKDTCQGVTACSGCSILQGTLSTVHPGLDALSADFEGIGYALADLACLYKGKAMPPRSHDNRLWLALAAATGANALSSTPESGIHTNPEKHAVVGSMHAVCLHATL